MSSGIVGRGILFWGLTLVKFRFVFWFTCSLKIYNVIYIVNIFLRKQILILVFFLNILWCLLDFDFEIYTLINATFFIQYVSLSTCLVCKQKLFQSLLFKTFLFKKENGEIIEHWNKHRKREFMCAYVLCEVKIFVTKLVKIIHGVSVLPQFRQVYHFYLIIHKKVFLFHKAVWRQLQHLLVVQIWKSTLIDIPRRNLCTEKSKRIISLVIVCFLRF